MDQKTCDKLNLWHNKNDTLVRLQLLLQLLLLAGQSKNVKSNAVILMRLGLCKCDQELA